MAFGDGLEMGYVERNKLKGNFVILMEPIRVVRYFFQFTSSQLSGQL